MTARTQVTGRLPARRLAAVLALLGTGFAAGCDLVDQRTFDASASRPPVPYHPPPKPGPPPIPPLIEIIAGTPASDWQAPLERVVKLALARKANVLFTVQVLVPPGANPAADSAALAKLAAADGQNVTADIIADGARPLQVEMAAMPDSGVAGPRIKVYVR